MSSLLCMFTGHVDRIYEITRHHLRLVYYSLNSLQSFQHPASVTCLSFNYHNPTSSIKPVKISVPIPELFTSSAPSIQHPHRQSTSSTIKTPHSHRPHVTAHHKSLFIHYHTHPTSLINYKKEKAKEIKER
ncbi:hypothetical protein HDV62DRAFT_182629 [Trichoderma sp. SZMC 28011]